ncbi:transglutaminaseTgpA domain-containing protein [soil metagenome]
MKGKSPVFGKAAQHVDRPPVEPDDEARWTPAEGWTAFGALAIMLATVAVALDDAVWVGHIIGTRISQTSFVPFGAVLAVAVGLLLAKSSLPTIKAHVLGATAGAAYLLFAISAALSTAPALEGRLRDLNLSVVNFVHELFVLQIRSSETSVFLLTLGALIWAAGQFSAFAVFRRQRPLPAILIPAVPLLINVSLTVRDQYLHVVVFFAAALLLLVRLNLVEQVQAWRARAIGDGATVSSAFLRSGAVFIALALVGSTTLAANTHSAPLGKVWSHFDDRLIEIGYEVNRVMGGVTGAARGPSIMFAPSQTIREIWESSDLVDLKVISSDPNGHRLRGAAYADFDGRTWHMSPANERVHEQVEANGQPLGPSPEAALSLQGWREIVLEVTPVEYGDLAYVSPGRPLQVSAPTEASVHYDAETGYGGFIVGRFPGGWEREVPYAVRAAVPLTEGEGRVTENQLAAAGVGYPPWVERYTEIREGSLGPLAYSRTDMLVAQLPPEQRNPFHIAKHIQDWLRNKGGFAYQTDVRGHCVGRNLVDCFLEIKQGFCEYFATTMTMMLRTQQIPARHVLGYLPGKRGADGVWEVPRSAAHAWVEVYFPGYGWVTFDPTPGNQENTNLEPEFEPGAAIQQPPAAALPTPSFTTEDPDDGMIEPRGVLPIPSGGGGGGTDGFVAVLAAALLGLALLVLLAVAQFRRLPRTEPELAYLSVARLASRFGHGPRPTQTAYEFADGLGELVPAVRSELRVVATAKVEATYGARLLPDDALQALRMAYRRVRMGLLRLLWYRPRRRPPEDRRPPHE